MPVPSPGRFPLYFGGSVVIETARGRPATDVAQHLARELERLNANDVWQGDAVVRFNGWKRRWFQWRDIPAAERTSLDGFRQYISSAALEVRPHQPGVLVRYQLKCTRLLVVSTVVVIPFLILAVAAETLALWQRVLFICVVPGIWLFQVVLGAVFVTSWFKTLLRRSASSMQPTP